MRITLALFFTYTICIHSNTNISFIIFNVQSIDWVPKQILSLNHKSYESNCLFSSLSHQKSFVQEMTKNKQETIC